MECKSNKLCRCWLNIIHFLITPPTAALTICTSCVITVYAIIMWSSSLKVITSFPTVLVTGSIFFSFLKVYHKKAPSILLCYSIWKLKNYLFQGWKWVILHLSTYTFIGDVVKCDILVFKIFWSKFIISTIRRKFENRFWKIYSIFAVSHILYK